MTGRIVAGHQVAGGERIQTDVCIIGSGCGGATLAKYLAQAGLSVAVLERGAHYTEADFDQDELNMNGRLYANRSFKSSQDGGTLLLSGNNVGGASVHYWADTYRTPADRLAHWADRYGLRGHGEAELAPIFDELTTRLNVHPAGEDYQNRMNRLLRDGARTLGWEGHAVPQARKHCLKSGHCMQGCTYGAKQSQLVTHIPDAVALGATVYADIEAMRLERKGKRIQALEARIIDRASGEPAGKTVRFEARAFALAAGGYYSPPFLIANGFKTDLPALGAHFGNNPTTWVWALYDEDIVLWRNIPAAFGIEEFRLARFDAQGAYREGGYLLMANQVQPGTLGGTLPLMGDELGEWMSQARRIGGTIVWLDDFEHELGRIDVARDGSPVVTQGMGPVTQAMLRDAVRKQVAVLFASGAKKLVVGSGERIVLERGDHRAALARIDTMNLSAGGLLLAAPHPFGGCRMGDNPATSVVGMNHRVHGTDNLYVADPSVFPTGPSVDPSFTIMAFSVIAARHIAAEIS